MILAISVILFVLTVGIHYIGLREIARLAHYCNTEKIWIPPILMLLLAVLHVAEMVLYSFGFYGLDKITRFSAFAEQPVPELIDYFYMSGVSYTTVGLASYYPAAAFKILSVSESLAGFMMLTWSATFFYSRAGSFIFADEKEERNN